MSVDKEPAILTTQEEIPLPEGYQFMDRSDIDPDELMTLRESVGFSRETPEIWKDCINDSIDVAAVRDDEGNLVGIGFLSGTRRHAVLCDFVVSPEHQGKGIGTAILKKRMETVEKLEIPYVYTDLAETNPLRKKYAALGFVATSGRLFRNRNLL